MTTSQEPLPGINPLGPNPPEQVLRGHLAAALNAAGYGQLCLPSDRPQGASVEAQWIGALATLAIVLSGALAIRELFHFGFGLTTIVALLLVVFVILAGQRERLIRTLFFLWFALGALLWIDQGFGSLLIAYGTGVALALVLYALIWGRKSGIGIDFRALFRGMPLVFPLVLLLLFVPLVTGDLWRVAVKVDPLHLSLLALFTVLPLAMVLGWKLVASLPGVIQETSASIAAQSRSIGEVHPLVERLLGKYEGNWVLNHGRTLIQQGFEAKATSEYAPFLTEVVKRPLGRALVIRTLIMLIGLGIAIFFYLYVLAALVVDAEIARGWSEERVSSGHLEFLGASINPPGGPYIEIAALLGIVALGAFLALLIVEEAYSRAITSALLHEPVKEYLLLALPYVRLRERVILGEAPSSQEGPLAPESGSGRGGAPAR